MADLLAAPASTPTIRPATEADLPDCERIWRESLNDYLGRLGQHPIPEDNPGLRRLHTHALSTDPDLFRVATRPALDDEANARDGELVVAFGSAVRRGPLWFLSMLFVDATEQARGLGRRILGEIMPAPGDEANLATATDSAQPISNGLYASYGILPRQPLFNMVGRPRAGWSPPPLPDGISVVRLEGATAGLPSPAGAVQDELDALDRELLGFSHPEDHAFVQTRRTLFVYRDAADRLAGYGYASEVGQIGSIAVLDAALMGPVFGHLLTAIEPRGSSAIWMPGGCDGAFAVALDAGLRFEDFPLLLCWNRPVTDFGRYVPISPGLL